MRHTLLGLLVIPLAIAGLQVSPGPAAAHAVVVEATPAVNATVRGDPVAVTLRFNSRVDRSRSRLTLIDADGKETAVALEQSSGSDVLAASVRGLAPGKYRLRWQVLAIDGHITRGDIPFTVAAP